VVIDRGRVLQIGPPSEIFTQPATTRVASLIGQPSINLLPGEIVQGSDTGGLQFVSSGGTLSVPLGNETPPGLKVGEKMLVGVRPQHVEVFGANGGATAQVIAVEDQIVRAVLRIGNGDEELRVALHESVTLAAGDKVGVRVDPASCLIFDPESNEIRGTLEGHR
jgi:ABC-type sugar transport system ATPase subunit